MESVRTFGENSTLSSHYRSKRSVARGLFSSLASSAKIKTFIDALSREEVGFCGYFLLGLFQLIVRHVLRQSILLMQISQEKYRIRAEIPSMYRTWFIFPSVNYFVSMYTCDGNSSCSLSPRKRRQETCPMKNSEKIDVVHGIEKA